MPISAAPVNPGPHVEFGDVPQFNKLTIQERPQIQHGWGGALVIAAIALIGATARGEDLSIDDYVRIAREAAESPER